MEYCKSRSWAETSMSKYERSAKQSTNGKGWRTGKANRRRRLKRTLAVERHTGVENVQRKMRAALQERAEADVAYE
ncbi:hypothetical protein R1flu_014689 [Riccia fluitans]|uniref:Uncharacterized protein n=1 Tax=Riccia fluitans TaxID=41844 RepID=A0ABD1YGT7_9MARC